MKPSLLRRLVRYGLPAFGVAACAAALYLGYCERQTRAAVARLEKLGADVLALERPYDWWATLANAIGISPGQMVPSRRLFSVRIPDSGGNVLEMLRHVANLPEVTTLSINQAPDCDDAALALVKDCRSVEILRLINTSVTDAGIRPLVRWERLKLVVIRGTPVTAKTEQFLRGLPNGPTVLVELR